jgi:hypothetical protein
MTIIEILALEKSSYTLPVDELKNHATDNPFKASST